MSPTTIESPVINSPFIEPARHFRTTADGSVTGEIEPRRRPSEFFVPVARPKKTSGQLTLDAYGPPARQLVVEIRGLDVYDPTIPLAPTTGISGGSGACRISPAHGA
ncbi:MAG: hypothetical protein ACOYXS_07730 [Chloroflexota bacterium]